MFFRLRMYVLCPLGIVSLSLLIFKEPIINQKYPSYIIFVAKFSQSESCLYILFVMFLMYRSFKILFSEDLSSVSPLEWTHHPSLIYLQQTNFSFSTNLNAMFVKYLILL